MSDESPPAYAGPQVMHPAHVVAREATKGLAKLTNLAKDGDSEALMIFHSVTCTMVKMLNERHFDYSAAVLKWPVLLPQDRTARNTVTKLANEMRIGSVKAGGLGAAEKLDYNSDKGFALQNLRRLGEARRLLRMAKYDGNEHEMIGEDGRFTGWMADVEFMEIVFTGTTEIATEDPSLLSAIRDLPDYCEKTRKEWIVLIVRVLKAHSPLVPQRYIEMERKIHETKVQVRKFTKTFVSTEWRGGVLKKALSDGLKHVTLIPGY